MKRSARNIARTINLSQPTTCEKPPLRKLVSADVAGPCPSKSSYITSRPVSVRICTRKHMERTCPPKLCDCPPKEGPPPSKIVAAAVLMFKGAIAGGLVYWTSAEGLWGGSSDTEDLYYRMVETVAPALPEFPDLEEMKLPHLDSMKHSICEGYNHFVFSVIGGLVNIPTAIKNKIVETIFPCNTDENSTNPQDNS